MNRSTSDRLIEIVSNSSKRVPFDKARMLDLFPGYLAYFDREMRFVYANGAYAALRGFDEQTIIGMHCREVVGNANFAVLRKHMAKALEGDRPSFEYDLLAGGHKKRVQVDIVPDIDERGIVVGAFATITDLSPRLDLQARIAESEALFDDAFSNSLIGMAIVDTTGKIMRANASFAKMLGRSQADLVGMSFSQITYPDDINADMALFKEVLAGNRDGYKMDKRYLHADGGTVTATLSVSAMRNAAGEIVRFVSQVEDVTEQRKVQRVLSETNAKLSLAMEVVRGGFWHFDIASGTFETSDHLAHYIAGPQSPRLGAEEYLQRMTEDGRRVADFAPLIRGELERNTAEYELQTVNGVRWMRCDRQLLRNGAGEPANIVGVAIEITEEHEQLTQSERRADTDSLTGLLNRRGLESRFGQQSPHSQCGFMAIDLDRFKQVNDTLGHDVGDGVLIETAERLRACVREGDLVARLGGDEFVVVLVDADETTLKITAERIKVAVHRPYRLEEHRVQIGCSIGLSSSKIWPAEMKAIFSHADDALYEAKAAGKNAWRLSLVRD